jgi:hypothetical protein
MANVVQNFFIIKKKDIIESWYARTEFLLSLKVKYRKIWTENAQMREVRYNFVSVKIKFPIFQSNNFLIVQVLRDRELQGGRNRGEQAQGGHTSCRGRHQQVQEGEPHHVRLGDQGSAAL